MVQQSVESGNYFGVFLKNICVAEIICHSQNTVCEYDYSVETLVVECHFSRLCLLNEYLCRSQRSGVQSRSRRRYSQTLVVQHMTGAEETIIKTISITTFHSLFLYTIDILRKLLIVRINYNITFWLRQQP